MVGTENYEYCQQKFASEISRRVNRNLKIQHLHQLVFHPPSLGNIKKVGQQAPSHREVFHVIKPTQLSLSLIRTIKVSSMKERKDVLGVVTG